MADKLAVFFHPCIFDHDTGHGFFEADASPYLPILERHPENGDRTRNMFSVLQQGPIREALDWQELKSRVHNALFGCLDLSRIGDLSEDQVKEDVSQAARALLDEEKVLLNFEDRERIVREIQHEVFGLGPLEPLLQDKTVNDILVNGSADIRVERAGRLEKTVARFKDDAHLMRIIDKIVSAMGRRVDETSPMVDDRLEDGSRVNAIIPPLALQGPVMSIRRFAGDDIATEDLIGYGSWNEEMAKFMEEAVRAALTQLEGLCS